MNNSFYAKGHKFIYIGETDIFSYSYSKYKCSICGKEIISVYKTDETDLEAKFIESTNSIFSCNEFLLKSVL